MSFKEFVASNGETLIYTGSPDMNLLDNLAEGPGDLWHSSLDQGFNKVFPELIYQTAVFWWFLNDFQDLNRSINWRINPNSFVLRKSVWELFGGLPSGYESNIMSALDLGYRMLRHGGAVPMYIKGLYAPEFNDIIFNVEDRYRFFRKNFKSQHSVYMLLKRFGLKPYQELNAFIKVRRQKPQKNNFPIVSARSLNPIQGRPKVSVVIPTMFRQDYTLQLLKDYSMQSYQVHEVIVVDATPEEQRVENIYSKAEFDFNLIVKWQESKGSCRARNEAIQLCTGDYIIFADDDTRILPDFVENHLKFLQTYQAKAANGLDISANNHTDGLNDLRKLYDNSKERQLKAGAAMSFSNANSCVETTLVHGIIGNDINFDGGYGEDTDFGLRLLKAGAILMQNPYSPILHLKPPSGGYRHWGIQSSLLGKARKKQAWELDHPVRFIKPVPSPTILYGIMKHYSKPEVLEYRSKYFFLYLFKGQKNELFKRLLKFPYRYLQFKRSFFYSKNLIKKGERY